METLIMAFANTNTFPLPSLIEESMQIKRIFQELKHLENNDFIAITDSYATLPSIIANILKYQNTLVLFSFSGRGEKGLLFDDNEGLLFDDNVSTNTEGIIGLLESCPKLKIVLLNGSYTVGQVKLLLAKGIPVVIATSAPTNDKIAAVFSVNFYKELAQNGKSIREAFIRATEVTQIYGQIKSIEISPNGPSKKSEKEPNFGLYFNEGQNDLLDSWRFSIRKSPDIKEINQVFPNKLYRISKDKTIINTHINQALQFLHQYRIDEAIDEIDKLDITNFELLKIKQERTDSIISDNIALIHRLTEYIYNLKKEVEKIEKEIEKLQLETQIIWKPIVLLTFAANGLEAIKVEIDTVCNAVDKSPLVASKKIENTTVIILADAMIDYGNELVLFHFGGHSEQSHIVLDDLQKIDMIRFSRLLTPYDHKAVPLVFLNGCLSYGHVGILTAKGVKAIIATNAKVNDTEAARLANYFYRWFFEKNATLRKAFENAEATVSFSSDSYNRGLGNDKTSTNNHNSFIITVNPGEIGDKQSMPASWTLFVHSGHTKVLDWTLQDFVNDFNK